MDAAAASAVIAAASNAVKFGSHKASDYNLKYLENCSAKSVDESKASVYFTPNDGHLSPEPPLQLQLSPIHINYIEHEESDGLGNVGDTPKSFKSIVPFGGGGGSTMPPTDAMVVRSILKPPAKFLLDKNVQRVRKGYQPNRLSGGYGGDELGECSTMQLRCYNDEERGDRAGEDSCEDEGNYSLKHNRKHKRKRKVPTMGGCKPMGGPTGGGCEYETLLMKNLSADPKESHYKIIHVNKLDGGGLGYAGTSGLGAGWTAGRAAATRKKPQHTGEYYYSLEDMIQESNEKIRKLIYDSKMDIMNEVITGSSNRDKVSGSSSSSTNYRENICMTERPGPSGVMIPNVTKAKQPSPPATTVITADSSTTSSSSNNNSQNNSGHGSRDSPSTSQNLNNYHQPLKKIQKLHFDSSTNRIQQSTSLPEIFYDNQSSSSSSVSTLMHHHHNSAAAAATQPTGTTSNKSSNQSINQQQQTLSSASSTASNAALPPTPYQQHLQQQQQPKVHGKHVILAVENSGDDSSVPSLPKPDGGK